MGVFGFFGVAPFRCRFSVQRFCGGDFAPKGRQPWRGGGIAELGAGSRSAGKVAGESEPLAENKQKDKVMFVCF